MHSRRYPIDRYNRRSLPLIVQGGILKVDISAACIETWGGLFITAWKPDA